MSSEEEQKEEGSVPSKRKKKKSEKKRKKKKKHKKKSGRYSSSGGSDSETIYPSDLKRGEEGDRYRNTLLHIICLHSYFNAQKHWLIAALYLWLVCVSMQAPGCSISKSFLMVG